MAVNQTNEKQNSNVSLSKNIEKRREIVKKICNVKKDLSPASINANKLSNQLIKSNEELHGLRNSVKSDPSRYQARLKQHEADNKTLREASTKAGTLLNDLKEKLEHLQTELNQSDFGVTLDEVLVHQDNVELAGKKVSNLEALILSQQDTAAQESFEENDPIDSLLRKREELLADHALGEAAEDDIKNIDIEIDNAINETAVSESKKIDKIQLAKQTVSGLQRRLVVAQSELEQLESLTPEILDQFLMTEAETEAEEYLHHANELILKFKRLMALDNIIVGIGQRQAPVVSVPGSRNFYLPAFKAECFEGVTLEEPLQGIMFTSSHDSNTRAQYIQKEKERLISLGIEGL